ncbi:MAG: hypothetical protein ACXQTS_05755 [Candidatus Methanospirareceae archaeon]
MREEEQDCIRLFRPYCGKEIKGGIQVSGEDLKKIHYLDPNVNVGLLFSEM